jgi:4'-phosphopantetheinyl transferase
MMLRALPPRQQLDRFVSLWTLKESYVKARGFGLSAPLDAFAFEVNGDIIMIRFDYDRLADDPAAWQFALIADDRRSLIALGADTGGAPLDLRASPIALCVPGSI